MQKKPILLVLAAGIGSRYGGLKQVDGMGPNDQSIIDYSVYDAKRAGFGKVVFIIRKEIEKDFREKVGDRISKHIPVEYTFQELNTGLEWFDGEINRVKPWGTGHAMLAAKDHIDAPFAVINADDFYGRAAFSTIAQFLTQKCSPKMYSMVGYRIQNTLSDFGYVSRGVCSKNASDMLTSVTERTNIERKNGVIYYTENDTDYELKENTPVSMNFWGFHPNIMDVAEQMFREFIINHHQEPKTEFYIPKIANAMIESKAVDLEVLDCDSQWYGVTYTADKETVQAAIRDLTDQGVYPEMLWA